MKYEVLCLDGQTRTKYFERGVSFEEVAVGELFYHGSHGVCWRIAPHLCVGELRSVANVVATDARRGKKFFGGSNPPYYVENE